MSLKALKRPYLMNFQWHESLLNPCHPRIGMYFYHKKVIHELEPDIATGEIIMVNPGPDTGLKRRPQGGERGMHLPIVTHVEINVNLYTCTRFIAKETVSVAKIIIIIIQTKYQ